MDGGDEQSEDEGEREWTEGEKDVLRRTVDTYVAQASTLESPFCGAPPSNLTHVIARAILSSTPPQTPLEGTPTPTGGGKRKWRHGLKATRAKILALVKERQSLVSYSDDTPRADPDATPRKRRVTLVRQGSMDFLPETGRNVAIVARLGSKLHRSDSLSSNPPSSFTHHHPYPLHRTHSLSSIAGSPTQPPPPKRSLRMVRGNSETGGGGGFENPLFMFGEGKKRSAPGGNGEGLGSAFPSPSLEGRFGGKKVKRNQLGEGLGMAFSTRGGGGGFFLGGEEEDSEFEGASTSTSYTSSATFTGSSFFSSSASSASSVSSPSPMSSTFDLLNLSKEEGEGREEEDEEMWEMEEGDEKGGYLEAGRKEEGWNWGWEGDR